jgi:hypothetical protein
VLNNSKAFYFYNTSDEERYFLYEIHIDNNVKVFYIQSYSDSYSTFDKDKKIYFEKGKSSENFILKISLLHLQYDDRIWPSIFYSSSNELREQILIGSMVKDEYLSLEKGHRGLSVDELVTVVTYKCTSVSEALK